MKMLLVLATAAVLCCTSINAADICVERVLSGSVPKVNFQSVPGYSDIYLLGDLAGLIKIYSADSVNTGSAFSEISTLLDIRNKIDFGGERGLLGVAVHKSFYTNGRFYVSFSCLGPTAYPDCNDGDSIVDEYRVLNPSNRSALIADVTTRRRIFRTFQPYSNHNGGLIIFSPDPNDPHLYMMLGDGGSEDDPDNRAILRIDVDSTFASSGLGVPPTDNPYYNVTGALGLIWVNGVRNPWRCSFDRLTFRMICGDVGQDTAEEIDIIVKGHNYGWSKYEANLVFNPSRVLQGNTTATFPILSYLHSQMPTHGSGNAVTGGYAIRTSRNPSLEGKYVFADISGAVLLATATAPGKDWSSWAFASVSCSLTSPVACGTLKGIYSFGEMVSGDILWGDLGGGVFRIVESSKCGSVVSVPCTKIRIKRKCRARRDCVFVRRHCVAKPLG